MVQEAARGAPGLAQRPALADLPKMFGLQDSEPGTETTVAGEKMALIELVEKQADGDLAREMLAFAAERIMVAEVPGTRFLPCPDCR